MRENKDYIRKRKPIDIKIEELNGSDSEVDKDFMVEEDVSNINKRIMPRRKCKRSVTIAFENETFPESLSNE